MRGGALVRTASKGEGRLVPEQEHMGWRGRSTALAIFKSDSAHFERADARTSVAFQSALLKFDWADSNVLFDLAV